MVFHWSLSDSKSPQVSRTLHSILAVLNNVVVWMVSTRSPTSKWYYLTYIWEDKGAHNFPKGICPKMNVIIFTQPLHSGRIWHKVNDFERSLSGLNSEFSFS